MTVALHPRAPEESHADRWDSFINSLMFRSLPTLLSTPCTDCGEFEITCACVREGEGA